MLVLLSRGTPWAASIGRGQGAHDAMETMIDGARGASERRLVVVGVPAMVPARHTPATRRLPDAAAAGRPTPDAGNHSTSRRCAARGELQAGGSVKRVLFGVAIVVAATIVTAPGVRAADPSPTIVGHRGDRATAPENTVAAARNAIKRGANAIEFDVRFTATGYPYVMHDATVDRTTNCSGYVSKMTGTQLKRCKANDYGKWPLLYPKEYVPSLYTWVKAVAAASSTVKLVLELKTVPTTSEALLVLDRLDQFRMRGRTTIISFKPAALDKMRSLGFAATRLGYIFTTPDGWTSNYPFYFPHGTEITQSLVDDAHARGHRVNGDGDANRGAYLEMGVDWLTTDDVRDTVSYVATFDH